MFAEKTVFEATKTRQGDKRKRQRNDDAGDIEGYLGPWGKFVDEKTTMVPDDEEKEVCVCILLSSWVGMMAYYVSQVVHTES